MRWSVLRRRIALAICPELAAPVAAPKLVKSQSQSRTNIQDILELSAAYQRHKGLSHWRVSYLVRGDGQFIKRLSEGRSCTVKTANAVLQWFSDNWPDNLPWPSDIPRPVKREDAA